MHTYRLAYRHDNGEVEGFVGNAFTDAATAERNAIRAVTEKCTAIGKAFNHRRILRSFDGLTAVEEALIRQDWGVAK